METSDVSSSKARYYVYILYFYKDQGLYIGFTSDLKNRLMLHAAGKVFASKDRIPFKLIRYEFLSTKQMP